MGRKKKVPKTAFHLFCERLEKEMKDQDYDLMDRDFCMLEEAFEAGKEHGFGLGYEEARIRND